jgi:hypothetical protein
MKKIYFLALGLFAAGAAGAQTDTLIWEDFNGDNWSVGNTPTEVISELGNTIVFELSPGITGDDKWYNIDLDGLTDANNRPAEWFRAYALADSDSVVFDGVMASSSWFTPFAKANNWLITKSFYCSNDAVLSFYSAPRQTPLYLDGYRVIVSTLTNDPSDFKDTIFTAKEFVSLNVGDSCNFGSYTFAPSGPGFVHGQDGTFITYNGDPNPDCRRHWGLLRQHTVNLSQFAGKRIYIAFVHDTDDDNLITIDNVLVTGTFVDDASINEADKVAFSAYPNPANDFITLGFQLDDASDVNIRVIDNLGRVVSAKDLTNQSGNNSVTVDVANLAAGVYTISLETAAGKSTKKFVKK